MDLRQALGFTTKNARLAMAMTLSALPVAAMAQQVVDTRMENDTAASRLRPEYDQQGVPAGTFLLFPTLTAEGSWNSNIYARSDVRDSDEVIAMRPVVNARSQWTRNQLNFLAQAEVDRYATHTSEDVVTWSVAGNGRFELGGDTAVSADAQFANNIEQRGTTGDTLFGAKPVAYGQITADLKLEQGLNRTRVTLSGHVDRYRYVARELDGSVIDLSYRDYTYLEGKARVAQAISPGVAAYVDVELDNNTYAFYVPAAGQRDSTQYAALFGFAFGINRLLQGEAAVGYFHRTFRADTNRPIGGLDYNLSLVWSPTRLTTINLTADKAYQRAPMLGVAGFEQQDAGVTVVHELLRNVLLRPGLSYSLAQYVDLPFHDRFISGQFGATWLLSPHWQVDSSATHRLGRFSDPTLTARNFDQNRFSLALTYRF
jgi:hypothetical protein